MPNVYNSLQSSFLSFAWPWPGRSLPKGNQWEWWDPQHGPLPGLDEVGHCPGGTSGSAGTLDWGPMWLGSQSTCHPNGPLTPPTCPWHPLQASYTPTGSWPLHSLPAPMYPWHPLHPCLIPPTPPTSCQWEYWDCGLGPNMVGFKVHLLPPMPPTPPTASLMPLHPLPVPDIPCQPHPLNPCWWECWDPGLGPNVVGLPVHLPSHMPPTPPTAPDAPTPCWPLTLPSRGIWWPRAVLHQITMTFA